MSESNKLQMMLMFQVDLYFHLHTKLAHKVLIAGTFRQCYVPHCQAQGALKPLVSIRSRMCLAIYYHAHNHTCIGVSQALYCHSFVLT